MMMALALGLSNFHSRNLAKENSQWSQKFMYRDSHHSLISNGGTGQSGGCKISISWDLVESIILCSQDGSLSILYGEFNERGTGL